MIWWMKAGMMVCILSILPGFISGAVPYGNNTITLERGMCFGTCPVYSLTLSGDGTVMYHGQMYVKEIGVRNGTINASVFSGLVDQFEKAGFYRMKNGYTSYDITDMPSATLTLQEGNRTKRVEHYYGDLNAPKILTKLEDLVDQAVNVTEWTTPFDIENTGRDEL